MRYAIYYTPPAGHPLAADAAAWLGHDPHAPERSFETHDFRGLVNQPSRYGFHATLKAPFRLRENSTEPQLLSTLEKFCQNNQAIDIPPLALRRLGPFFALVPAQQSPELDALAARVVRTFEPFRARLTDAELERRKPETLTDEQRAMLAEWGYPYVFDEFQFHMTLTGPVPENRVGEVEAALQRRFERHIGKPLTIAALSVFKDPGDGAPFSVIAQAALPLPEKEKAPDHV